MHVMMKKVLLYLLCIFAVPVAAIGISYLLWQLFVYNCPIDISFGMCITIVTTTVTISLTFMQYSEKKKSDKMLLLLDFNKRFMTDKVIQNVIDFLQKCDETGKIPESGRPPKTEFQMFARFFEELQQAKMDCGFKDETVCRLFAYYAITAYDFNLVGDMNDESWHLFVKFVKEMKSIENKLKIKH